MKKVLVISDNAELVSYIKNVVTDDYDKFSSVTFTYCFSVVNKNPDTLIEFGMTPIDAKSKSTIKYLASEFDLIISAHCKQIFPSALVKNVRCINVHPGLNPYNRGWYPQVFSIINKKAIGCTIHVMDEFVDHGDVIYQKEVDIYQYDTSLDVYNRVIKAEMFLLRTHLIDIINQNYALTKITEEGNYNGISDFNNLCELDLSHNGTLSEHIDLLRALSHGSFKNAYFRDRNGKKIFLNINLGAE